MSEERQSRRNQTVAYSIVDSEFKALDVATVISNLIEKDVNAWQQLPKSIKDLLISTPHKFKFVNDPKFSHLPLISFNGVTFKYHQCTSSVGHPGVWMIKDIEA